MTATPPSDAALIAVLKGEAVGVLLYGSYARGDATEDSDVDVLQMTESVTGHYQVGLVSVSLYSEAALRRMCQQGSLFALHLATEGRILSDPDGRLKSCLTSYRRPPTYEALWQEVEIASQILAAPSSIVATNTIGFTRLALYLLRTTAILRQIEATGTPGFAIPALAASLRIPKLVDAFRDREKNDPIDTSRFALAVSLLELLLRAEIRNPHGSLEALAINEEHDHPIVPRLILRLLAGAQTLGYGDALLDLTAMPNG